MKLKIALIGSGNLAFHLATRLFEVGSPVSGLIVRNKQKANDFQPFLTESAVLTVESRLDKYDFDLVALAVSDSAIPSILKDYSFPEGATVVHTSGSQPISIFENSTIRNFGVLYPLQTFTKGKEVQFDTIPIFTDGNNEKARAAIKYVAKLLTENVKELDSEKRLYVHLAAVIASNFPNMLYSLAQTQLQKANLDFDILEPLIKESVDKALKIGPKKAQTGPATRRDMEIVNKHLNLLEDSPQIRDIYSLLSKLIEKSSK